MSVAARVKMFEEKSPRLQPRNRPCSPPPLPPLPATSGNETAQPDVDVPDQPQAPQAVAGCVTFSISTPVEVSTPMEGSRSRSATPGPRTRSVTPSTRRRIDDLTNRLDATTVELERAQKRTLESDAAREMLVRELTDYKISHKALEEKMALMTVQLFQVSAALASEANRPGSSAGAAPPTSGTDAVVADYEVWSRRTEDQKTGEDKEPKEDDDAFHDADDKEYLVVTGDEV